MNFLASQVNGGGCNYKRNVYNVDGEICSSKQIDKVMHVVLFQKLIKLGLPPSVIKLLYFWYVNSNVYVRWGMCTSFTFMLNAGVRQGGVLSPIFFLYLC